MPPNANPETNRTLDLGRACHKAYRRLAAKVSDRVAERAPLRVTFADGTAGEIHSFLSNPKLDGTVFEPLRDPANLYPGARRAGRCPDGRMVLISLHDDNVRCHS